MTDFKIMELKNYDVLLVLDQSTGFGDNYGNIYSSYVAYDILTKLGLKTCVLFNSKINKYFGYSLPDKKFFDKIFNLKNFKKDIKFYIDVPTEFTFFKNVDTTYMIYLNNDLLNNDLFEEIKKINFNGYTHHLVKKNIDELDNSYYGLNFINSNFVKISKKIKNNNGKIIGIHIRMPDGIKSDNTITQNFKNKIERLFELFPNHKFLISGLGFELTDLKLNEDKILNFNKETENFKEFFEFDILEMCLFSECEFIFTYCNWDSAYLSYAILKKIKNKKINNFLHNLL